MARAAAVAARGPASDGGKAPNQQSSPEQSASPESDRAQPGSMARAESKQAMALFSPSSVL